MSNLDKTLLTDLADLLKKKNLQEVEYETADVRIRLVRERPQKPGKEHLFAAVPPMPGMPAPAPVPAMMPETAVPPAAMPAPKAPADEKNLVRSPMVGIAFLSPEPGAEPFVKEGTSVKKGDTLCLIEAMKTFNPLKADRSGIVKQVLVDNGQPVEFDQPLFNIE